MFKYFDESITELFTSLGLQQAWIEPVASFSEFLAALLLSFLLYFVARKFINQVIKKIAARTTSQWDDILIERKVFDRLAYLAPAYVLYYLIPIAFESYPELISVLLLAIRVYTVLIFMFLILAFLDTVFTIYQQYDISKLRPIKGYIQVAKIIVYIIFAVLIISVLVGQSPILILGGLGAFSAVLLLVFKDSLLGLVAGVQLTSNDMLRPGDWITVPKFDADGIVTDITLTSVKIQNADKTISIIPAYSLFTDSFKNWRGMQESGGRRIKRWVNIDMNSIKFCTPEMLEKFRNFQYISEYVQDKEDEIGRFNKELNVNPDYTVNGRRQTNIGIFRAYLMRYLQCRQDINPEMNIMVRHLQPAENGLPIEIYCFSIFKEFNEYENLQADIFDHVLAVIPEFDLRIFQNPTGNDYRSS
jgi:miniconductance mechanosensitive channel